MSVYFKKSKGWRYDFTLNGMRHTEAWFETKKAAQMAEAEKRKELLNPEPVIYSPVPSTLTDMDFKELVNQRLDYVKAYNSERHYTDYKGLAKRWVRSWGKLSCSQVSPEMIQHFLIQRLNETSAFTANKELRYLRALFNFAMDPVRKWMQHNPTAGIRFFPTEKRIKYVPPKSDVLKVILAAEPEIQDYLWAIVLLISSYCFRHFTIDMLYCHA